MRGAGQLSIMLLGLVAGLASATTALAQPSAVPPAAAASKPIREVVFHVSFTRRQAVSTETFGGMEMGADNSTPISTGAPVGSSSATTDRGTVTVDVMQVTSNALGVKVTEEWASKKTPATYLGNIAADGTINFGNQVVSEATEALLPFFGPHFTGDQTLDQGSRWTANLDADIASKQTTFTVKNVDGPIVTLDEVDKLKMKGARGMDSTLTGTVAYKPSRLVAVSGTFHGRASKSDPQTVDTITTEISFTRASDTRDQDEK